MVRLEDRDSDASESDDQAVEGGLDELLLAAERDGRVCGDDVLVLPPAVCAQAEQTEEASTQHPEDPVERDDLLRVDIHNTPFGV